MKSKLYLLFICYLVTISQINIFGKPVEVESKLYFSENPIIFDPPMIQKGNTHMIPIRSLLSYFDGTITQSKKSYAYTITVNNTSFIIKQNKKEYTQNSRKNIFKEAPLKYKTRLYVPLKQILNQMGYKVENKNNNFYAYTTQKSTSETNQKIKLMYNYKQLKNNIQSIYLPISGVNLPLKKLQERGNQYVDLSPFLKFLGYKISIIKNNAVLKKGNQVYSFKHLSNVVRINVENSVVKKTIQSAPIIRNQTFFVNIHSFLNDLGYSYILKNNQLIILRKLHFIELSNNNIILSKNSQINLGRGNRLSSPPRLFWDLPYTHCPSNKSIQTTAKITNISFGQNGTTCRMVFHLNSHQIAQIEKISKTKSKIQLIRTQYKQPTIAKRKSKSLKGKVIIIDPGHGGSDPGAVTKNKDYEKNYTLDISKRIKKHLERQGAKAILLRKNDTNPSLYQRVIRTNRLNGDFLISVHVNSFINEKARGTETYYYKKSEKRAAQKIQQQLVKHLKLRNNGIKFAKMYVLKNTKIPGVLIEPCFMTNPNEYQKLKTVAFRENIAKGTVAGLNEYFKN